MSIDLLKEKRLREQRADIGDQISRLERIHNIERRDLTDAETAMWRELNPRFNELTAEIRAIEAENKKNGADMQAHHILPGRADFRAEPEGHIDRDTSRQNYDLAIGGWLKNAAGEPVNDEMVAACRSMGVSIHSGTLDVPFERSSSPKLGRDWYGRHERRAQETQSGPAGGYTVAGGFIASLDQAMLSSSGALQVSEVMSTSQGNDMPWPTTDDTANEGALIGENDEATEQDISFGQVIFRAHKVTSKMVRISTELLQDSAFNLATEVGKMLGTRIGRIGNRLWTVGTGASQPMGLIPAATVGVTAASATAITTDEVLDLIHAVDPAYRVGAKFMMNDATTLHLRKLKGGDGQYLWQPSLQAGQPDRLLGYEVVINHSMADIAASAKPIAFGALNKYKIRLAGGVRIRRLVERYAEFDQEGFIAFSRLDGQLLDAGTHPVQVLQMHA